MACPPVGVLPPGTTLPRLQGDATLSAHLATCFGPGSLSATEKAAKRWLGDNPLNPTISIIRLWGVIAAYRRAARRGRWSKALVRHGADPREALAGVLGVPSADIRVRDRPE